jgi:hypothetical protein
MTWLSALTIGITIDVFIGICLALLVHADKRYQAKKLAQWRAEGIYWPESVDALLAEDLHR